MGTKLAATVLSLVLLVVIAGCSNPYSQFYQDYTNGMAILENDKVIPPSEEPRVVTGGDPEEDGRAMAENGYVCIGMSSFNAGEVNQKGAVEQAMKVHADTVIVYYRYTNTISGSMPMTMPNTQTSYHSGNVYGMGGSANYYGSSTTYGTTTTYVPYHVKRYDYLASYWVKMKYRFGARFDDLKDEQRQEVQSNKGAYIVAVVKGSPAFDNDILAGDIVRKVNGLEIIDAKQLMDILGQAVGEVQIEIVRRGDTVVKTIKLDS